MKLDIKIKNGFTLVELMITVSILAILISIATASYRNYIARSKVGVIISYLPVVKNAVLLYINEHNDQLPNAGQAYSGVSGVITGTGNTIDITQINNGIIKVQITSIDTDFNNKIINLTPIAPSGSNVFSWYCTTNIDSSKTPRVCPNGPVQ